jgi:hypothetical protein
MAGRERPQPTGRGNVAIVAASDVDVAADDAGKWRNATPLSCRLSVIFVAPVPPVVAVRLNTGECPSERL